MRQLQGGLTGMELATVRLDMLVRVDAAALTDGVRRIGLGPLGESSARDPAPGLHPEHPLLGPEHPHAEWRCPRRGEQLTLLAQQLHARQSSSLYAELVAEARLAWQSGERCPQQGRNLDLLEQDLRRQQALDPDLVGAIATAKAKGYNCWQQARAASDFASFAPALQTLVDLRQEQTRQLQEPRSCWETLAQPFDPI